MFSSGYLSTFHWRLSQSVELLSRETPQFISSQPTVLILPHLRCRCRSVCIEYQSVIQKSCGSGLWRHAMNISRAWWTMRLINGKTDWQGVSMQKVVTLSLRKFIKIHMTGAHVYIE